jgi:LPXTG-motif cell wall-anchored protein
MLVSIGSWYDPGDIMKAVAKVAVLPITLPWQLSAEVLKQGIGSVQSIRNSLQQKPPPSITPPSGAAPADPALAYLGIGGGTPPLSGGGSSSNLPLIIGGVAAAALLLVALLRRRQA